MLESDRDSDRALGIVGAPSLGQMDRLIAMTVTITTVSPDSGPLWKIHLALYRVDACSLESGYCS